MTSCTFSRFWYQGGGICEIIDITFCKPALLFFKSIIFCTSGTSSFVLSKWINNCFYWGCKSMVLIIVSLKLETMRSDLSIIFSTVTLLHHLSLQTKLPFIFIRFWVLVLSLGWSIEILHSFCKSCYFWLANFLPTFLQQTDFLVRITL